MHRVAILVAAICAVRPVYAENRVASVVSVYTDDDATDVVTSVTRVTADAWDGGTVEASYLIDVITSASVDLVTQATGRFEENRHALGAAVSQTIDDATFGANYGYSVENDYVGHGFGANGNLSLFQENTTLGLAYHLELSRIGRAQDPTFERSLTTQAIGVSGSQILSTQLLLNGGYDLAFQNGYNAKPYRYARVGQLLPGVCRLCPPEAHPSTRFRHALYAGLKLHIVRETAAEVRYRLYVDSWSINAHTAELIGHFGWDRNFGARLRYRLYIQNGASFYQNVYSEPQEFMTGDRELSALSSHLLGLKLFARLEELWIFESVQITAKLDVFQYDYRDFAQLPRRRGLVAESGLEVVF